MEPTLLALLMWQAALALTPQDATNILQIEVQRLPAAALEGYASADDAPTRARAARALGRLKSAAALPTLARLVNDEDASVRAEVAFALALTPDANRVTLAALQAEKDPAVRAALLDALGRQGDAAAIPDLLLALEERPPLLHAPVEAPAAAEALGRLGMRNLPAMEGPAVSGALLAQLRRFDRLTRQNAAFALARLGRKQLPDDQRATLLSAMLGDRDPVVRAFLVRASATLELDPSERAGLYLKASQDQDTGVRIATARAAATAGWPGVDALLSDPEVGVRLEAIAAIPTQIGLDPKVLLKPLLDAGSSQEAAEAARQRGDSRELLAAAALTALLKADLLPAADLDAALEPARPTRIRAAAAGGSSDRATLIRLATRDGEAPVRTSAVARLLELEPGNHEVLALFDAFDPMVLAAATEWLIEHPNPMAEDRVRQAMAAANDVDTDLLTFGLRALKVLYSAPRPRGNKADAELLALDIRLMTHPDAQVAEAAAALAPVLGLTAPAYSHHLIDVPLDELSRVHSARIETSRGELVVELLSDVAPVTVWNFATLSDKGWFDGLFFHRVVPDFVVQTGDPRGDGWGGPGYAIPDELSPLRYDEGVLGMALSGPDTGGSQWFITLSPQPHLDGNYTVFGRVISGGQVLRDIQQGDRVLHVRIERSPAAAAPSVEAAAL